MPGFEHDRRRVGTASPLAAEPRKASAGRGRRARAAQGYEAQRAELSPGGPMLAAFRRPNGNPKEAKNTIAPKEATKRGKGMIAEQTARLDELGRVADKLSDATFYNVGRYLSQVWAIATLAAEINAGADPMLGEISTLDWRRLEGLSNKHGGAAKKSLKLFLKLASPKEKDRAMKPAARDAYKAVRNAMQAIKAAHEVACGGRLEEGEEGYQH